MDGAGPIPDPWPGVTGEMADRVRTFDWAGTPLGAVSTWPESVRAIVGLVLSSPIIATLALGDERRLIYNDAAARLYGERHPAALGRPLAETFPDSYPSVAPLYDRVFAGESITVNMQPLAINGEEVFDAHLTPVRNAAGAVIGAHMTGLEIGERVRTAEALRASETRYRAFVTASTDVVYRMSADWSEMRELDGRGFLADTRESNQEWMEQYIHPDDCPTVRAAIGEAVRTRTIFALEHRVVRSDGTLGWTSSRAVPILGEGGEPTEWLGTASDVTEKKRVEERVREGETHFRLLADSISQLAWTCDSLGNVNWYNRRWLDYTGLSFDEMKSWGWEKVQHPDHVRRVIAGVERSAASGEPWEDTFPLRRHDGEYRWFYSRAMPIRDRRGDIVQWFGTNTDVTEQRRAEDMLRENEERQAFLLRLSDALRPLAVPGDIADIACGLLVDYLGGSQAQYADVSGMPGMEVGEIRGEHVATGTPFPRRFPLAPFGEPILHVLRAGETLVIGNVDDDARLEAEQRGAFHAVDAPAVVSVPLVKGERWLAALTMHNHRPRDWAARDIALIEDVAERTWAAIERARAEAALRDREAKLRLLVAELQHRVRNILTVIRLTFSRTFGGEGGAEELADHFRGRLDAMARTQVALTRHADRTANLEDLIRDELLSVGVHADSGEVTLSGPEVELDYKTAESLAMGLHELTTNALKYGALMVKGASLNVTWKVNIGEEESRTLDLVWSEQGVPAIDVRPVRRGFGRELIEEALPYRLGADSKLEFRGGGVRCLITVPLGTDERDALALQDRGAA